MKELNGGAQLSPEKADSERRRLGGGRRNQNTAAEKAPVRSFRCKRGVFSKREREVFAKMTFRNAAAASN